MLAPEGLGPRADLSTTPPGRTLQVPGGTQALARSELVPVRTTTGQGHVPRPSLLGAIIVKAAAVGVDDAPHAQRLDLAFLLSLVDDPVGTAEQLNSKDRKRLSARDELRNADHPTWHLLPEDARDRARATLRILQA